MEKEDTIKYKPIIFLVFVFLLTWFCAFIKAYVDFKSNMFLLHWMAKYNSYDNSS